MGEALEEVLKFATLAVAGVVALWKAAKTFVSLVKRVSEAYEKIDRIAKEFEPNGGASIRDLLDRLEGEIAVQAGRARHLVQDSRTGILEVDATGGVQWSNHTAQGLLGLTQEEALGCGWLARVSDDDRARVSEEWGTAVRTQREGRVSFRTTSDDPLDLRLFPIRIRGKTRAYTAQITPAWEERT